MDVESKGIETPEKKEEEDPFKEEAEDEDDSEDSVPLKQLAAKKQRGKGTPATKVTMGRKKTTPVQSPPADHNLDFEEEESEKGELIFKIQDERVEMTLTSSFLTGCCSVFYSRKNQNGDNTRQEKGRFNHQRRKGKDGNILKNRCRIRVFR